MTQGFDARVLQDPGQDYLHRMLCGPTLISRVLSAVSIELKTIGFSLSNEQLYMHEYSTACRCVCSVSM